MLSQKVNFGLALPLPSPRHSPLEKSSHSSHTESSVFKQPPPLEPAMSSPPPSLRDPPWPHGGTPPGRPSASDRSPTQSQRKDSPLVSVVPGHRVPRPYNKVASSKYKQRGVGNIENKSAVEGSTNHVYLLNNHAPISEIHVKGLK